MTGLSNRRDYSILMIDLDDFKKINDAYGHSIGDEVLKHNANICLNSTRTEDLLARYNRKYRRQRNRS